MCLAVPGRVLEVEGLKAQIDFGGVRRAALTDLLPDVRIGEFVLVHAGFVIQRMDAAEAAEISGILDEILQETGEVDTQELD